MPCSRLYASGQAVLPRCPDQTCRQRVRSRWSLGWRRPGYSRTGRPGIVYVLQGTITDHRDGIATEGYRRRRSRSTSSGSNRRAAAEPAVSNGICRDLPCASFRQGPHLQDRPSQSGNDDRTRLSQALVSVGGSATGDHG